MFCRSLFVLLYFFFWPLCCLFFFDIWILITTLVSSNSSYTPSQGTWSMFYILRCQLEWMNTSLSFSTEIWHYMVANFVSDRTLSCLSRFVNFASTFSIKRYAWIKYNSVVWNRQQIFRISFTQRLTLRRISRTSNQRNPHFTFGINNYQSLHFKSSMTCE
jgi:hypothetical protein